jgi:hypothetical protein
VWASTVDQSDVDTMNALIDIDEQLNLLPGHVFQFDFLNSNNILYGCIYFNDCFVFTLFHAQNRIFAHDGNAKCVNHWIPFTPEQVDAKEMFESAFMSNFLKSRAQIAPISEESQSVFDAGLALWQYYHAKIKNNKSASVNASFYDIRLYFQGRTDKGTMNSKSADETYNHLLETLKGALKVLTQKIQPKVYQYGFLKK